LHTFLAVEFVLLAVQTLLVLLLVVVPLFSGYDKWRKWKPARKAIALAIGLGIGIVAFSTYKRLVVFRKSDLPGSFTMFEQGANAPWYARQLPVMPLEYVISVAAGAVLIGFAMHAARQRRWTHVGGFTLLFCGLLAAELVVKLGAWH
jgi:hypothetical protein